MYFLYLSKCSPLTTIIFHPLLNFLIEVVPVFLDFVSFLGWKKRQPGKNVLDITGYHSKSPVRDSYSGSFSKVHPLRKHGHLAYAVVAISPGVKFDASFQHDATDITTVYHHCVRT